MSDLQWHAVGVLETSKEIKKIHGKHIAVHKQLTGK